MDNHLRRGKSDSFFWSYRYRCPRKNGIITLVLTDRRCSKSITKTPSPHADPSELLEKKDLFDGPMILGRPRLEYLEGRISEDELLTVVNNAPLLLLEQLMAHRAIGMSYLARGDRKKAMEHFVKCSQTNHFGGTDYHWSQAFLERLNNDDAWPEWIK